MPLTDNEFQLIAQLIAAFAGAFASFFFLRLAEFFTKVFERKRKHYNAMVKLDHELNEQIGVIKDLQYSISSMRKTLSSKKKTISYDVLTEINYTKSLLIELNSTELKNDLYSLQYRLRRTNDDVRTINKAHDELKAAFVSKNVDARTYLENRKPFVEHLEVLELYLDDVFSIIIELLAKDRILIRSGIPVGVRFQKLFDKPKERYSKKRLKIEVKKIESELEQVGRESGEKIREILQRR